MMHLLPKNWNEMLSPMFPHRSKDLGIAVVGAGAIVNAAHLPAYKMAGLRVVGIYDIDVAQAQRTQARYHLPTMYSHLEDLLRDPDVDIVDIAVPSHYQLPIVEAALAAGKHVLCQKPLATSWEETVRVVHLVRQHTASKVAVNQQMRWSPVIRSLAWSLEHQLLGSLLDASIQVSVFTDWTQWPWILGEPYLLSLFNTIHLVDSFRFLFGTPARVYARGGRAPNSPGRGETQLFLSLEYDADFIGWIHDHHQNSTPDRYAQVRCEGTKGVAKGTIGIWENYPVGQPDKFELWSEQWSPASWHRPDIRGGWIPDAFQGPMADLMWAIEEDRSPVVSVEDNAKTLATVFAAIESMTHGGVVALDRFKFG